jgi:hypothetical protein
MKIIVSPYFKKRYKKIPKEIKERTKKNEAIKIIHNKKLGYNSFFKFKI